MNKVTKQLRELRIRVQKMEDELLGIYCENCDSYSHEPQNCAAYKQFKEVFLKRKMIIQEYEIKILDNEPLKNRTVLYFRENE